MKTIKEIAQNAGFTCEIERRGVYTFYTMKKGECLLLVEHTAQRKNLAYVGYKITANGPINHNFPGVENYEFCKADHVGATHALAKNGDWFLATIEQVETIINNN